MTTDQDPTEIDIDDLMTQLADAHFNLVMARNEVDELEIEVRKLNKQIEEYRRRNQSI